MHEKVANGGGGDRCVAHDRAAPCLLLADGREKEKDLEWCRDDSGETGCCRDSIGSDVSTRGSVR